MVPVHPLDEAATARAVIDENGILARWSEGARRLLGYAPEEVEGRPATDLLDPAGAATPSEPTGNRWSGTLPLRHHPRGGFPADVRCGAEESAGP